mgnify:CR=1 FL=1
MSEKEEVRHVVLPNAARGRTGALTRLSNFAYPSDGGEMAECISLIDEGQRPCPLPVLLSGGRSPHPQFKFRYIRLYLRN